MPYFLVDFGAQGVRAYFTTRRGGVSRGPYTSLNLGFHTGDSRASVAANRSLLSRSLRLKEAQLATTRQVHGDRVLVITEWGRREIPEADAQITALPGVALTCLVADCQAVYLYDPVHRVIGLAHAGWRGAVAGIARKCLEKMSLYFGSKGEECLAALSPAAGPCCYEVGNVVADAVAKTFPDGQHKLLTPVGANKWHFHLGQTNIQVLHEAGVLRENIIASEFCTICRQDIFFSYRGSGGVTGRMAALLILE